MAAITDILNYLRNRFGNYLEDLRPTKVAELRTMLPQERKIYTEAELNK